MYNTRVPSERDRIIDAVARAIPLDNLDLPEEFFPAHLPVALIDAMVHTRLRPGEPSVPASERYCGHFGIARIRADRWVLPPACEQESLSDLVGRCDRLGLDAMACEVLGFRPRRSGRGRATSLLRATTVLRNMGIDVLQDMRVRSAQEMLEALAPVPGFCANTARRVLMYAGDDDFVRGDVHVRRFVARALGRGSVSPAAAEALVRDAAYELILSPRFLDREIWLHGLACRSRTARMQETGMGPMPLDIGAAAESRP